jgi:hypothetical protein
VKRLRAWVIRLSNVCRTNRREDDIADELESHLEMQVADNVRAGMTPEEARRQALIKLGGLEQRANIATLQLTRAAARQTELAVRAALGAGRFRLIRQLLLESLVVGVFGGDWA